MSRCLHWAAAYLLGWQFTTLLGWRILGDGEFMRTISNFGPYHGTVGVLVLAIFVPRFCWAFLNRKRRRQPDGSVWSELARGVHIIFNVLMFVVPALALRRAYGNGKGYDHWGLRLFPPPAEKCRG
ncbi:cytochrome b/b6 domain-containing protein [Aureimonas altamirensis]|uniref:cytochrome b/b6 domain-containing protein n=1 Tax=Aureimonas altamirensis TaxID=370622 RepID=UPI00177F355B|nr:hypothetical protein IGS74_10840 [Aureimonas sp. OT7]